MMRLLTVSALSARRAAREFNIAASRSGSKSRSTRCCDQAVKLVHPYRSAFTRALAFADTCRAGVVAVNDAVLGGARAQGHPTPTRGAHRQTRQEDRAGCNARRDDLWTASMKLALNLFDIRGSIRLGTGIVTTSSSGLRWRVRDEVLLNFHWPM